MDWTSYHYVKFDGQQLLVEGFDDEKPQEIKLVLKEVKLCKKELAAERRVLTQQIAEVRADHRDKQAHRLPAVRGGGGFGKFLRTGQAISKANDRSRTASAVSPLEDQKFMIDKLINGLDHLALQVERMLT